MKELSSHEQLLEAIAPYLKSSNPIEALHAAGFFLSGEAAKAATRIRPKVRLDSGQGEKLLREIEGTLPIRLHVGERPSLPPSLPTDSGFRAAVAFNFDPANEVVNELFRVGTLPNALTQTQTDSVISIDKLREWCVNVPAASDAATGPLEILTAPYLSASQITTQNLHFAMEIRLPVTGSQPSYFQAAINAEVPIVLDTFVDAKGRFRLRLDSPDSGPLAAQATVTVNALSPIGILSADTLAAVEADLTKGVSAALFYFSAVDDVLTLPGKLNLKSYPNTTFTVTNEGGVTVAEGNKSFGVLGINIDAGDRSVNPAALASMATPEPPYDFHAEFSEAFANDALGQVISGGDLAAFLNRIPPRHWWGFLVPTMYISGGSVSFQNGNITLQIGVVLPGACLFVKDIDISVQISGPPQIAGGQMTIGAQYIDMSVSTWDEIVCSIVSLILPFLEIVWQTAFIELSIDRLFPGGTVPSNYVFAPIPGSDKDWTIAATQASANDGILSVNGTAVLAADPRYFIYLRIVTRELPFGTRPIAGAQVTLLELDNPAPAGDDVVIPKTGTTIHFNSKFTTETTTSYQPNPDQNFGTETTDANGDVLFVLSAVNNTAGWVTAHSVETDNFNGSIVSNTTSTDPVLERYPDFGVHVTDSSGLVLAERMLVALNLAGNRLGTAANPLIVEVEIPVVSI